MNPHDKWCHNPRCRAYGLPGEGHVVIHSQKERRYQCKRCRRTFTETKGTALYRLHKPRWLMIAVLTLLAYGCPLQAVVAALTLLYDALRRRPRVVYGLAVDTKGIITVARNSPIAFGWCTYSEAF